MKSFALLLVTGLVVVASSALSGGCNADPHDTHIATPVAALR